MILTKYIAKSCVVPELDSDTKPEVLKELTHLLFDKKRLKGVGPALDQVMAREVTESTGIGGGIAVPHARVSGIKTLICAVGRSKEGIDFQAIDKKPVHLVFLICYPATQQTSYLNFVATVARMLSDADHAAALLNAETAAAMYDALEMASGGFTEAHVEHVRQMRTDPAIEKVPDAHADLILLARLQLYSEMLASTKSGKAQLRKRIESIRGLVEPRILNHYDRLMKARPPAIVAVEGDTCQGCFMKLPTRIAQVVRQDTDHVHTCDNCSRFIYVV